MPTKIKPEPRKKKTEPTKVSKWLEYFHNNGYCKSHDTPACWQCKRSAEGVCPSYWEESY